MLFVASKRHNAISGLIIRIRERNSSTGGVSTRIYCKAYVYTKQMCM